MHRLLLRPPQGLRRPRPYRARRAIAQDAPLALTSSPPRWVIFGTGILGALVGIELIIGIAVTS